MAEKILIVIVILLSGFVCYFLAMIAKFYRLKSGNGLHHGYYYISGCLLILGLLFSWDVMPLFFAKYFGPALTAISGVSLMFLAMVLYKSMMSINKNMG